MTNLNTKILINFLPFDPKQKLELLENYDLLPKEEQLKITSAVWDAFSEYERLKIKENFEKGIDTQTKNKIELDNNYYVKILDQTEREINAQLAAVQQTTDISSVRKSMEKIVREINASKKTNTP